MLTGIPTQAHIGTHNVKITADNGTQTTDQEFTITVKGAPTVGSFADISKSIGDANFSLTAPSSNSAGAFTYTSSNIGVATISGNMVTITGAGTTTITATQAADGFYDGASVTATLTVGIKPPGNALTFDGSGDFVQIGNANTFDARNMKTIEAWVKFNDLVNEQEIIISNEKALLIITKNDYSFENIIYLKLGTKGYIFDYTVSNDESKEIKQTMYAKYYKDYQNYINKLIFMEEVHGKIIVTVTPLRLLDCINKKLQISL